FLSISQGLSSVTTDRGGRRFTKRESNDHAYARFLEGPTCAQSSSRDLACGKTVYRGSGIGTSPLASRQSIWLSRPVFTASGRLKFILADCLAPGAFAPLVS